MKIFSLAFCLIFMQVSSQYFGIYQTVDVDKYGGKTFNIEGKIKYKNTLENASFAVLGVSLNDDKGKQLKAPLFNENAGDFYKENDWSSYQLSGKIDKKAKYLSIMIAIEGNGSYYLDDFKVFVIDGGQLVEIPLKNAGFENDSLSNWELYNVDKDTKISITKEKYFSGKHSLYVDNSKVKTTPTLGNNPELGKYIDVNGVKLYYEVYGKGEPLLMLHGNNSSMGHFNNQLEILSKKYMVIGLDSRGQGKSTADDAKITYELMAEDVNSFLEHLKLKNVNVLGWSDGGNIALILAMNHPDKVKKMAVMGTVLYNNETSVMPRINELLLKQLKDWDEKGVSKNNIDYRLKVLLLTEPHLDPDSLKKIKAPTLVMAGEHDVVKEKHTQLIAAKIPNSELIIFKGADHEAPEKIPAIFNQTILKFFEQ